MLEGGTTMAPAGIVFDGRADCAAGLVTNSVFSAASTGPRATAGFAGFKLTAARIDPDVVILDLTLPGGMGGKEALKCLIEIDPTVNAIVSSGYAMDSTMSRYQDFGFRGVIAKPYEAAELGRTVYDVIQSSRVNLSVDFDGGRLASRVA